MKIETDIPIPTSQTHGKYPFKVMNVGDSISVDASRRRALMVGASAFKAKNPGWDYTSRILANAVVRLWRTA